MNFARNMKCWNVRGTTKETADWCDCKRPGEASFGSTNSRSGVGYGNGRFANKVDIDSRLADNEEKAERWFSKISQLDSTTDMNSAIGDEDFPEIMPLRKGVNSGGSNKTLDTSVSKSLDEILGRSSAVSGVDNNSTTTAENAGSESRPPFSGSASSQYGRPKGNNSSYAPFVHYLQICLLISLKIRRKISNKYGDNLKLSEKPVSQAESKVEDKEQAEKSERWFKKVAELHDVTDLSSAISDEDFPEIMPMRKGENRFVVSKKKDRSLTSPTYKRRLAMDQASKTNFVLSSLSHRILCQKDKQQPNEADSTQKVTGETSPTSAIPEKLSERLDDRIHDRDHMQPTENQTNSPGSWNFSSEFTRITQESNVRQGWTGKSLEGSAVKEPDPLDMSEEAKAEEVRREQEETPLERRLTSPQYRRNLPVVSSEPVKKENESG
ncbi:Zinc finger protein VAR3, chloroplastic [Vitis vinifera]|uniref:Zinc finger protein VAR3, chloroplastic n=1 Tax=Vitis vinifera TaxID=29760 RepID=A0A438HZB6_VITVI|nr:Zinc finger protein VAR3, chloroplastic [Vitis vinifera]